MKNKLEFYIQYSGGESKLFLASYSICAYLVYIYLCVISVFSRAYPLVSILIAFSFYAIFVKVCYLFLKICYSIFTTFFK